ncbi:MAG: hypothetical protein KM310_06215 [Clostridiales bacterium]|nr:hypothetical protein [Clostridiales bacterium]
MAIYASAFVSWVLCLAPPHSPWFPTASSLALYLLALLGGSLSLPQKEAFSRFFLAAQGPVLAAAFVWSGRGGLSFSYLQSLFLWTGLLQALLALSQALFLAEERVRGTLGNANTLSQFLLPPLLLASSLPGRGPFSLSILLGLALFLTGTRAGWGGALLGAFYLGRQGLLRLTLSLALSLLIPSARRRWTAGSESLRARLNLWEAAWRLFLRHPLGVGLGQFPRLSGAGVGAHQTYLQLLSELGLPGLLLALYPWVHLSRRLEGIAPEGRAFQAIFLAAAFHGLFNSTLQDPRGSLTLWAAFGLAALLTSPVPPRTWRDT